jgi:hypothetical protein
MARIEIYPSGMPGEPLETHNVQGGTFFDWLKANCPSFAEGDQQPISVEVNGVLIPHSQWGQVTLDGPAVLQIRPNARDPGSLLFWVVAGVAATVVITTLLRPNMPRTGMGVQGEQIAGAELKANTPRLNGVIPEVAGRFKLFPDYLCQPRRYFVDEHTEAIDAMLCIGTGEFQIDPNEIFIGDTPVATLEDAVTYAIFAPGANVSGNQAHRNWFNMPEVGFTRSSSGLRLIDEDPADPTGEPSTITGSIAVPITYATSPVTFAIDGDTVVLSADYATTDDLLIAINGQLNAARHIASIGTGGVLVITEVYPFSGVGFTGTGDIEDVFGTPVYVTGEISTGLWLGPFRLTPSSETASQIEFDIFAPQGLGRLEDNGTVSSRTRSIELQWRTNGGAWTSIIRSVSGNSRDQFGFTFAETLPAAYGNIDVRMRRIGAESKEIKDLDRLEWYGMRCLLPSATSYAGVTTMAITVIGTDRISASSENKINLLATRKLNGTATRSIAEWVRYVCGTVGYGADDINEAELTPLETLWNSRGDWFDMAFIGQTTVKEVLQSAFRTGFADLTIDAGKIRPARDQARTTFEHVYTPQNMTAALRRQFTAYDPDDYDGVDVEYTDANTWEQETVECRLPGDAGTRVEKIRIDGVTNRTRAWRIGMRQRRIQVYRRKVFSFSTEWDALNSRYLSYCALTDDVPGYGQSALLEGLSGSVVTVSEPLRWESGASHVVAFRRPDGTLCGPFTASKIDDYTINMTGSLDFTPIIGASAIETTHVIFGKTTTWSYPVLVTEISPSGDTVDVSAVIYDARVYSDDDNSPA